MVTVLLLLSLAYTVSSTPVRYDQRQEGDFNVHAHLENFVIVLLPSSGFNLLDLTAKAVSSKKGIADGTKLSSPDFPASKSPYKVDIHNSNCDTSQASTREVLITHSPADIQALTEVTTQYSEAETTLAPAVEEPSHLKDKLASTIELASPLPATDSNITVLEDKKQAKPKAINFDTVQDRSTYEEQVPVLEFSQFLKAINGASAVEDKIDGLEACSPGWRRDKHGRCEQMTPKQRSLLSALQYGISPAN